MYRSQLTVKPKKLEALLFYDQLFDGNIDFSSEHAGCPVIEVYTHLNMRIHMHTYMYTYTFIDV